MRFTSLNNQRGITLIEVLIAIFLLVAIMLAVTQRIDDSINRKEVVTSEDNEFVDVERALNRFAIDFEQIYSPLYYSRKYDPSVDPYNFDKEKSKQYNPNKAYKDNQRFGFVSYEGHVVPIFESKDSNSLKFMTLSNRRKIENIKQSSYAWVHYYTENMEKIEDEQDPRYGQNLIQLMRLFWPENIYENERELKDAKPYIVLKNIKSFEFFYWNPKRKNWEKDLLKVKDGKHKIEAVKIKMVHVDQNKFERQIERIYRPMWPQFEAEDLAKLYKNKKDEEADLVEQSSDSSSSGGASN